MSRLSLLFLVSSLCLACQDGRSTRVVTVTAQAQFQQCERLARPAINEGLIVTNDLLNAFNSVPPSADFSAAAQPVRAEALATLDAVDDIDGQDDTQALDVALAFLPDVMRIDTTLNLTPADTAYNASVANINGNAIPTPVAGRKLEDDVVDITLSLLVAADATGATVRDNVSYEGVAGNAAQPGHKRLNGQSTPRGSASFPFLAAPN